MTDVTTHNKQDTAHNNNTVRAHAHTQTHTHCAAQIGAAALRGETWSSLRCRSGRGTTQSLANTPAAKCE